MIFETHIHFNDSRYQKLKQLINEAEEKGVKRFLTVSYDLKSCYKNLEIIKEYDNVFCALGIHPNEVPENIDLAINELEELIKLNQVKAIGEAGLDYHYPHDKERQKILFIKQIDLANKYNLPIIIHSRDAAEDTCNILKMHPVVKGGIMHCFSYSLPMAQQFIKLGYFIAFGGAVTFNNAKNLKAAAQEIPLEWLLVETDGPYLAPEPHRGALNQPWMITLVVKELARLKNIDEKEIEKATYNNANRLLGLSNE